jgi:hypothetical protein
MRLMITGLIAAVLTGAASSPANADCTCRGPGVVAKHGQTVCLRTPAGLRLARCEMVLNNSSWTFLPEPCPEASRQSENEYAAAMSVVPPQLILAR